MVQVTEMKCGYLVVSATYTSLFAALGLDVQQNNNYHVNPQY